MKSLQRLVVAGLLAVVSAAGAVAQQSGNEVACDDDWVGGSRRANVHICEIREFTLAAEESVEVNGSPNGSVIVAGRDRDEIVVQARIRSWDRDEDAARARLAEIEIETAGVIRARGPDVHQSWWRFGRRQGGWNVDFEISAPHDTDLMIESVNGRISVANMRGHIDAETINGGISLTDIPPNARGRTVNGGVSATLAQAASDGDILDLRTTNGGVVVQIPQNFSARLDVRTVNGGIDSDFPVTREGRRNREASATLGDGGPLIRARTVNGGVRLRER